ncbi:alpha-ketoglutarate decarboxylase [uncultured Lutibacter sp.]|uniref:alpha-ketoglutarate decarboxylase n=1 Tax=uncultured Lutibacter sp. TaxID=437739 RepID=UPI002626BEF1|nr:alpha-ketoglutarate decarboxylase [uncultured Lutibacter sp.]
MRKILFLHTLIIFAHLNLTGQNSDLEQHRFIDDVRFGGGINIGMGNNYSTFSISPSAIYDFSDEFSAGLGLTYVYVKNKSLVNSTTNIYGGSLLAFYRPISNLQFSSEFEQLKIDQAYAFSSLNEDASLWQPALYIGAEYVTGNISMGLRYDILYDKTTNVIYSSALSPVFRVYF